MTDTIDEQDLREAWETLRRANTENREGGGLYVFVGVPDAFAGTPAEAEAFEKFSRDIMRIQTDEDADEYLRSVGAFGEVETGG